MKIVIVNEATTAISIRDTRDHITETTPNRMRDPAGSAQTLANEHPETIGT
jgi:hypothetical protein